MAGVIYQYIDEGRYNVGRHVHVRANPNMMPNGQRHLAGLSGTIQGVATFEANGVRPYRLTVQMFGWGEVHDIEIRFLQPIELVVPPHPDRLAGRLVRQRDFPQVWGKIVGKFRSRRTVRVVWFDPSFFGRTEEWHYNNVEQIEFLYSPF